MEELHLTKNDFEIQWFSGTGGGGQHRNKHQNCCRIIHKETGLKAQSTEHKDRPSNQRDAFNRLAKMIVEHYYPAESRRMSSEERIRTYHAVRNIVKDESSGFEQTYKEVVKDNYIDDMILARKKSLDE